MQPSPADCAGDVEAHAALARAIHTLLRSRHRGNSPLWRGAARAAAFVACTSLLAPMAACAEHMIVVDSTSDQIDDDTANPACHTASGNCTLRAAIMQANTFVDTDTTITLPAGTFFLTVSPSGNDDDASGDLNLAAPLSGAPAIMIAGAGAAESIIDAVGIMDRVLAVASGRTATISGVTLRHGSSVSIGGGISNDGTLLLDHCAVSDNHSGQGTGVVNGNGVLTVRDSTISGNIGNGYGAGILNYAGTVNVVRSTIFANSGYIGAGISSNGTLFITNSTISANLATGNGGGIWNSGTANLINSTVVFNQADTDMNTAGGGGGGGVFNLGAGVFNLRGSMIVGNKFYGGLNDNDCGGTLTSFGNNRYRNLGGAGCHINQSGPGSATLIGSLAELGPLQDNGGPTMTHAIVPPSTMIGGAEPTLGCIDQNGARLATDQRGSARSISSTRCDIGAVEYDFIFGDAF